MKLLKYFNHGSILIMIALLHMRLAFSPDGFRYKFSEFAKSGFFRISKGLDELPPVAGKTDFETFAAFWFFYFGLLLIPMGILVFDMERKHKYLPHSFTISYLFVVVLGAYMIPNSGMTFIMMPHALFMFLQNLYRSRRIAQHNSLISKP